jgi:hypothetical protein
VIPDGKDAGKPLPDASTWARLNFSCFDNLENLAPDYIATLDAMSGIVRQRMRDGLWVASEGLVYPDFDEVKHVKDVPLAGLRYWLVSVDTGWKDPTVLALWAVIDGEEGQTLNLRELMYCPGAQLLSSISSMMEPWRKLSPLVVVDPSSSGTLVELGTKGWNCHPAVNKILDGVSALNELIRSNRFVISPSCCEVPLQEMRAYVMDPAKDMPDESTPSHFLDCARYAAMAVQGERSEVFRPYVPELDDPKLIVPDPELIVPDPVDCEAGWVATT